MATQIDIMTSDSVARRVVRDLHLADKPEVRARRGSKTPKDGRLVCAVPSPST